MTARVLITRPDGAWPELAARFSGSEVVLLFSPTTIQVEPVDARPGDAALRGLGGADWLVVTSARGAEHLFRRLAAAEQAGVPGSVRIAAVGEATARALAARGARAALVAEDAGSAGLADALVPRLFAGARVVLACPEGPPSALAAELRRAGAVVDEAPLYRTVASPQAGELAGAVIAGVHAAVVFTAPSSLRVWLEDAGTRRGALAAALAGVKRIAIGATTAAALAASGLPADDVAETPTERAVGDAIARALSLPTC